MAGWPDGQKQGGRAEDGIKWLVSRFKMWVAGESEVGLRCVAGGLGWVAGCGGVGGWVAGESAVGLRGGCGVLREDGGIYMYSTV